MAGSDVSLKFHHIQNSFGHLMIFCHLFGKAVLRNFFWKLGQTLLRTSGLQVFILICKVYFYLSTLPTTVVLFKYKPAMWTVKMSPNFFFCSSRNAWASLPNSRAFPINGIQPLISGGSSSLLQKKKKREISFTKCLISFIVLLKLFHLFNNFSKSVTQQQGRPLTHFQHCPPQSPHGLCSVMQDWTKYEMSCCVLSMLMPHLSGGRGYFSKGEDFNSFVEAI